MIPAEDFGGMGGITNWASVSMDDMMRMVSRNLEPHWKQADGWQKTNELMWLHSDRLNQYLEHLARVWNPDTSPASQAYRERLNELIASIKDVQAVASENVTYANDIPRALSEGFFKLQPVYQQYVFERSRPTTSPADEAARQAHMIALEIQARAIMYALGAALNSSGSRFQEPKPYKAPQPVDERSAYNENSSTSHTLPVIPPVVPTQSQPQQQPTGPVRPMPTPTGPDLSGLNPQQPMPTGPTSPTPGGNPTIPTPGGGVGTYPGMPPGGIIGSPAGSPGGVPRPTTPGPMTGGLPPRTGMPAGGVIGGAPLAGRPGGGGVVRPNPPGGIIGGATGGRGPAGAGASGRPGSPGGAAGGRGPIAGPLGGVHGGRSEDEDGEYFDPDTQWSVNEGVAPVVDAPETPGQIDPGPAIGLNR